MKTGDIVRDGRGRSFQIGQLLGRGLWGKTYLVREEGGGPEWALKIPLTQEDLGDAALASACREILVEQGRFLTQNRLPYLAPVEAVMTTSGGLPALLMPRHTNSLERRLASGGTLEDLLRLCMRLSQAARDLAELMPAHGNIKPSNVFLDERGMPLLADPVVGIARRHLTALTRAKRGPHPYLPPECQTAPFQPGPVHDTYAISTILYWGSMTGSEGSSSAARLPESPLNGLDKAQLVALKDRIHNRLKEEGANPRFHTRLSDRAAAFLNRALSAQHNPSPPYRFLQFAEYLRRMEQLLALVHPRVEHVGRILLDRPPGSDTYTTDEDVVFSCTIGCSPGVETHEEIACGLALFDREKNERIRDVPCAYTVDSHPSGRLRFGFRLSDLVPGSYLVRVAFAIRESGEDPAVAEGRFERRAAPGYVPPRAHPRSNVHPLEGHEPEPATQPGVAAELAFSSDISPNFVGAGKIEGEGDASRPAAIRFPSPPANGAGAFAGTTNPGLAAAEAARSAAVAPPPPLQRAAAGGDRAISGSNGLGAHAAGQPAGVRLPPDNGAAERTRPGVQVGPAGVKVGVGATITRAAPPAPVSEEDDPFGPPSRSGAPGWSPLPMPLPDNANEGVDLYGNSEDREDASDPGTNPGVEDQGPIGGAISKLLEAVRGDAYVMFIGGAAIIILMLIAILFALR